MVNNPLLHRQSSYHHIDTTDNHRRARVPYDTHAFHGQGDYSELSSPLLHEYKVPLDLLRGVYLSSPAGAAVPLSHGQPSSAGRASRPASTATTPTSASYPAALSFAFPPTPTQAAPSHPAHAQDTTIPSTLDSHPASPATTGINSLNDLSDALPPVTPTQRPAVDHGGIRDSDHPASVGSPVPSIVLTRNASQQGSSGPEQLSSSTPQTPSSGPTDQPRSATLDRIPHSASKPAQGGDALRSPPTGLDPSPVISTSSASTHTTNVNGDVHTTSKGWLTFTPGNRFPPVKALSPSKRKRILVTGGAGFVGSHLVDRLMFLGHEVTVLDNFFSGSKTAVSHWVGHPHFELVRHDVTLPFHIECDMIYHLACPASPRAYQYNQIKTMKTNFLGTLNMLGLAKRTKARFLLSSTSEVYGSPTVHPQPETYWGNVNPIGPRACYDEGKRVAEALTFGYLRQDGVDVRVARIFNSFGPRMTPGDGRIVSNFVLQALKGEDITIYGDGSQTRSLLFVHDLVDGLILLMNSECTNPVNIGSPYEGSILSWAKLIVEVVDEVLISMSGGDPAVLEGRKRSEFVFKPMPEDDPPRRQADTTRAQEILGWQPSWAVREGIKETTRSFIESEVIEIDLQSALKGKAV